jgi:hypothetical protein
MSNAEFGKINGADVVKGFVVAALTSLLNSVVVVLSTGALPTLDSLRGMAIVGLSAGMAYLVKNLLTNSRDQLLRGEDK